MAIAVKNMLLYGDSKTLNINYQGYLIPLLANQRTYQLWRVTPAVIAVGGRTTATAQAAVDAELAAEVGTPDVILYNLGANDVSSMPVQATYQTNIAYILDAFHTKWASALVYVMKCGRQNFDTECNTLVTWNTTVIDARSSWAFFGGDERVFLKGSDNYVTNTTDGTHANDAGTRLTAAAWAAVIP